MKWRNLKHDAGTFKVEEKQGVKWRSLVECVYYNGLIIMSFVCGLLCSNSCCCLIESLLFALCLLLLVIIVLGLSRMFCFLFCVLCFCTVFCVVSSHVYGSLFYICVQFYRPLPQGGNPTAVNKYRITQLHQHIYQPIEVLRSSYCNKAIWIRQLGKHPNFIIVFELYTNRHNENSKN